MLDVAFVGAGSREASGVWYKSTAKSIVEAAKAGQPRAGRLAEVPPITELKL